MIVTVERKGGTQRSDLYPEVEKQPAINSGEETATITSDHSSLLGQRVMSMTDIQITSDKLEYLDLDDEKSRVSSFPACSEKLELDDIASIPYTLLLLISYRYGIPNHPRPFPSIVSSSH